MEILSVVEELEKSIFSKILKKKYWLFSILRLKKRYLKEYQINKSINELKREIINLAKYITRPFGNYTSQYYLFDFTVKIIFEKLDINKNYNLIKEVLFKNSINNKIIKKSKIKEMGYKFDDCIFQEGQFYTSLIWKYRKKEVLKRDKYNCLICFNEGIIKEARTVHHIFSLRCYPEICMDPFNLISLCNNHHGNIYKKYPIPLELIKEKEFILEKIF